MKKLFETEKIDSGVYKDAPNNLIPLWADGLNVLFTENVVQPFPPHLVLVGKIETNPIAGAVEAIIAGVPNLFFGTATKLYRYISGGGALIEVTRSNVGAQVPYTGIQDATVSTPSTRWSFANWGQFLLAANGVDVPQIWKPTIIPPNTDFFPIGSPDGFTEFANWVQDPAGSPVALPFAWAQIVRTLGPYVLAYHTSNGDAMVEWCHTDNVELFTPAANNAAGNHFIRNLGGPVVAVEPLGRVHGIYGLDQLHIGEFIGSPFYFGFQGPILRGVGAVSKNSIAVVGDEHFGFGPRNLFRTNGAQIDLIDEGIIHDFIYNDLNRTQLSKVIVWYDTATKVVFFSWPSKNSLFNDRLIGYNTLNRTFCPYDFARTAATSGRIWPFPITFDQQGNIYQQGSDVIEPSTATGALPLSMASPRLQASMGYGQGGDGQLGYGGTLVASG